jgi:hypothetical protein
MRDLPDVKLFPGDLIDDMHKAFEAVCSNLGLRQSDKATESIATKIVELAVEPQQVVLGQAEAADRWL